jgi:hypothetical protein
LDFPEARDSCMLLATTLKMRIVSNISAQLYLSCVIVNVGNIHISRSGPPCRPSSSSLSFPHRGKKCHFGTPA